MQVLVQTLTELARRHEEDTRAFVTHSFPKVAALSGFDCKSRVVAELQAAIEESKQKKLGYVLLLAGTYLGAKGEKGSNFKVAVFVRNWLMQNDYFSGQAVQDHQQIGFEM